MSLDAGQEPTRTRAPGSAVVEDEPSIGELFRKLGTDTSTLVRQEVNLAVVEMSQKARLAALHARLVAVGAALVAMGGLALVAASILGLSKVMEPWLAALLVGLVLAAGGYAFGRVGVSALTRMSVKPLRTIETLEDNKAWAKALVQ